MVVQNVLNRDGDSQRRVSDRNNNFRNQIDQIYHMMRSGKDIDHKMFMLISSAITHLDSKSLDCEVLLHMIALSINVRADFGNNQGKFEQMVALIARELSSKIQDGKSYKSPWKGGVTVSSMKMRHKIFQRLIGRGMVDAAYFFIN